MEQITFTEKSPRELTIWADSLGEADWHYVVTTIPGTYVARCVTKGACHVSGTPCSLQDAHSVIVEVDAICTGGWVPGGKGTNSAEQYFGKPMPRTIQVYAYQVQDSLGKPDSPWAIRITSDLAPSN